MASAVAVDDPPLPEPPDPPDPLTPPTIFVQTSITKPSFLLPPFPPFPSSLLDLHLGSTVSSFVSSRDTLFACLRSITAVCRFQNQICSQIRLSFGEAYAHLLLLLTGFHRAHHESELPSLPLSRLSPPGQKPALPFIAPLSPRRTSCRRRLRLTPRSANLTLGFLCLGQWMGCLLGQWIICLLGQKWRTFLLGLTTPTLSPLLNPYRSLVWSTTIDKLRPKPSPLIKPRLLFTFFTSRSACSFSFSVIDLPLLFPQVCSYSSLSDSSTLGSYWMSVDSVALTSWNLSVVLTIPMMFDSRGSTFVLSSGTFIALVRPFTAVCRLYFGWTLLRVDLMQFGQRSLFFLTVPVFLVHWGFHSPHLSFKELVILPNTSLVFSGIVIGSIVVKTVLLGADARIVVQDSSRSAFVDGLTLEALFPPPCGFGKDFRLQDVSLEASVLSAFNLDFSSGDSLPGSRRLYACLVELVSSHLSLCFCLNHGCYFSFLFRLTMMWIIAFVCLALSSLMYTPRVEVTLI